MNYNSPNDIKNFLDSYGFSPQKKFGQNFLIAEDIRRNIINILKIPENGRVWEIGPGMGAMTSHVFEKLGSRGTLDVFEIDRGFIRMLADLYGERENFRIIEGDMIKTWKKHYQENGRPDRIFGNLPYNAASAMISSLIENDAVPDKMVFTVQKEVGQRMSAEPGKKDYSSFSVLCQFACDVIYEDDVSGGSFYPVPEVTSAVVSMTPHSRYDYIKDRKGFFKYLRTLFMSRRKTIFNNLKGYGREIIISSFEEEGIEKTLRAETLPVEKIVSLYDRIGRQSDSAGS